MMVLYLENFSCPQLRVSRRNFQRATTSDSELGKFPYSINVALTFHNKTISQLLDTTLTLLAQYTPSSRVQREKNMTYRWTIHRSIGVMFGRSSPSIVALAISPIITSPLSTSIWIPSWRHFRSWKSSWSSSLFSALSLCSRVEGASSQIHVRVSRIPLIPTLFCWSEKWSQPNIDKNDTLRRECVMDSLHEVLGVFGA